MKVGIVGGPGYTGVELPRPLPPREDIDVAFSNPSPEGIIDSGRDPASIARRAARRPSCPPSGTTSSRARPVRRRRIRRRGT